MFIASVLFEVLKTVTNTPSNQALTEGNAIHKKKLSLTFFHLSKEEFSMQSCSSPRLPLQLFATFEHCFGFQEANVANQREHLILLLANMQTRQTHHQTYVMKLGEGGVDELMRKFFKNYTICCKILERKSNIRYVS
ncbi:callose synthase [Trifolium repens]|nr:callose synthase [Trifolium repens]